MIAAFPFRIEMQILEQSNLICLNRSNNCYFQVSDLASGSDLNISFKFSIKDIYNKTMNSLNTG